MDCDITIVVMDCDITTIVMDCDVTTFVTTCAVVSMDAHPFNYLVLDDHVHHDTTILVVELSD